MTAPHADDDWLPARRRSSWSLRFPAPVETAFRADFDDDGRGFRSELWLGLLIAVGVLLFLDWRLLNDAGSESRFWPIIVIGLLIPMVLRWLSCSFSPVRRWSSYMYIAATYLDVAALMAARVLGLREGVDVVPLIVPTAILVSLIVAQIRFVELVPALIGGLVMIFVGELVFLQVESNGLFDLAGCTMLTVVPLALAYELERSLRDGWLQRRRLAELNRTDALTGLPNRRSLLEHLTEALRDPQRGVAVAVIDVDDFKAVNDAYGHPTGDDHLRRIGAYLASAVDTRTEFTARLSGEEFVVVVTDDEVALRTPQIASRVEEIRSGIGGLSLATPGGVVTASCGYAISAARPTGGSSSPSQLIDSADLALYEAKRNGRDQTRITTVDAAPRPRSVSTLADSSDVVPPVPLQSGPFGMRFPAPYEQRFRTAFDRSGLVLRRTIMVAVFLVCALLLVIADPFLQLPEDAKVIGPLTLIIGLMPASLVAALSTVIPRIRPWSTLVYVTAIAVIITAQMFQRVLMLPLGHETVPFLMPMAVLLSMSVVLIRFSILLPAMTVTTTGLLTTELIAFPATIGRSVTVLFALCMVAASLRFAYRIEQARRRDWENTVRLNKLARTDAITGLPNRRHFFEVLSESLTAPGGTALVVSDIDRFKAYNDRYGHLAGDACLRLVGRELDLSSGPDGFVARLGGEEFVIVLQGDDASDLERRAQRIRRSVGQRAIPSGIPGTGVTLSAGVAFHDREVSPGDIDDTVADLLERADRALSAAKASGRDRLVRAP